MKYGLENFVRGAGEEIFVQTPLFELREEEIFQPVTISYQFIPFDRI
jgi:hypothetical protein